MIHFPKPGAEEMVKMTQKRQNYLQWPDYFMSIAFLSAQRSKDPSTQVGACIVNKDNKVVGIGYNGMPIGCSDDAMPWNRAADASKENWFRSKLPYVCHAELNAVMNKNSANVQGCILYVALFPCNLCAQIIIQSGISDIVYYCDKNPNLPETKAAKLLLDMAGVKYRQYTPKQSKIIIDFTLIEETVSATPTLPSHHTFLGDDIQRLESPVDESRRNSLKENIDSTCLSKKRSKYLEWEEYFMAMAFLSAQRSKDPRTQVGACIVNAEKKIVAIGYNGMPIGCDDDSMPWNRALDGSKDAWLDSKSPYVCHAELNAVLNKNTADIKNCIIYVALFPCNMCAQVVIQSGIKEVVYYSDKYHDKPEFVASRHMLSVAGINYRQFRPSQQQMVIDFSVQGKIQSDKGILETDSETVLQGKGTSNIKEMSENDIPTNNNNVGQKDKSDVLENQLGLLDNLDQHVEDNVNRVQDVNRDMGWMNEVEELPTFLYSVFIAAVLVFFSWYAGNFSPPLSPAID